MPRTAPAAGPEPAALPLPPAPPRPPQFYSSGVIGDEQCCQDLNHGVLAVGYDASGDQPHYVVKNSWGDSWGEQVRGAAARRPWAAAGALSCQQWPHPALARSRGAARTHAPAHAAPAALPHLPQGYFKLSAKSKDDRGACGVLTTASYPTKKVRGGAERPGGGERGERAALWCLRRAGKGTAPQRQPAGGGCREPTCPAPRVLPELPPRPPLRTCAATPPPPAGHHQPRGAVLLRLLWLDRVPRALHLRVQLGLLWPPLPGLGLRCRPPRCCAVSAKRARAVPLHPPPPSTRRLRPSAALHGCSSYITPHCTTAVPSPLPSVCPKRLALLRPAPFCALCCTMDATPTLRPLLYSCPPPARPNFRCALSPRFFSLSACAPCVPCTACLRTRKGALALAVTNT